MRFEGRVATIKDDFARVEAGTGDTQDTRALLAELGRTGQGADAQRVRDDVDRLGGCARDREHAATEVEAVGVGEGDGTTSEITNAERAIRVGGKREGCTRTVINGRARADGEEARADCRRVIDGERTGGQVGRARIGIGRREDDGAAVEIIQDEGIGARQHGRNRQRARTTTEDVTIDTWGNRTRVGDGRGST